VLGNQLLIAWRPHPNVDVGWPAAVGDGHVALEAVLSSLASKHRGGHYGTFRYGDGMNRNKVIEQAAKHTGYDRSRGYQIVDIREGKAS
jgi:hypothetical protein